MRCPVQRESTSNNLSAEYFPNKSLKSKNRVLLKIKIAAMEIGKIIILIKVDFIDLTRSKFIYSNNPGSSANIM